MPVKCLTLLAVATLVLCAAPATTDVSLTLATKDGRNRYFTGEPIELELRISSIAPSQYRVWTSNTTRIVRQPKFDDFSALPQSGVADPLSDIFAQQDGGGIAGALPSPSPMSGQPVVIRLFLNEWLSLRQPGHYRIAVETTRVVKSGSPAESVPLRSDAIEIEVLAPKADWALAQLQKAVATLEQGGPPAGVAQSARVLRFLETRDAVPALARFFENGPSAAQQQLRAGLFGSPYRQDVIAAMEHFIAAPDSAVTYYYLATLAEFQQIARLGPTPLFTATTPEEMKRWVQDVEAPRMQVARAVESDCFARLAEAIKVKRGRALAVSLETLINRGPQPPSPASIHALTDNFADLPESTQHGLLTMNWPKIASPSMAPLLTALANGSGDLRDHALDRLRQLDPAAARTIAIERVRKGDLLRNSFGSNPRALLSLPDKTLPDLDDAMLAALEQGKPVELLIARYASAAALPRVRVFIDRSPASSCNGELAAYLFRVQPAFATDFVKQARARGPGCFLTVSPYEDLLISPGLERQAIEDLSSPDAMTRRIAQGVLQYAGSPEAEQPLWDALPRLRDRPPHPLDSDEYGISEALSKAIAWTLSPEKIDRLFAACLTESCRHQTNAMHSWLAQPVSISIFEPNAYATVGLFMPRSRAQLEQKIGQFPKGTAFTVNVRGTEWYTSQRRDEIRKILGDHGMKFVDPGSH